MSALEWLAVGLVFVVSVALARGYLLRSARADLYGPDFALFKRTAMAAFDAERALDETRDELEAIRTYAARMKAERDAWSDEAGRLGLELARLRTKR